MKAGLFPGKRALQGPHIQFGDDPTSEPGFGGHGDHGTSTQTKRVLSRDGSQNSSKSPSAIQSRLLCGGQADILGLTAADMPRAGRVTSAAC